MTDDSTRAAAPQGGRIAVALAGFLVMTVSGAVWGSFTLFLVAIEQDTGWSKTSIAFGFTVFTIAGACTAPITGALVDRFNQRKSNVNRKDR